MDKKHVMDHINIKAIQDHSLMRELVKFAEVIRIAANLRPIRQAQGWQAQVMESHSHRIADSPPFTAYRSPS